MPLPISHGVRDRLRAFVVHLAGSAVLALAGLALVYWVWYPAPLDRAIGVTHIFLLMLGVDVILGPLLTFAVFQRHKKSLKFDLSVIVLIQLAALAYGLFTVAQGRPAWLVFNVDRFDVVRAYEVDQRNLGSARPAFRTSSLTGPKWAVAKLPSDPTVQGRLLSESLAGGPDLPQRPEYYDELSTAIEMLQARAKPLDDLQAFNAKSELERVLARWPQADAWLPLMSNELPMVVLLQRSSGQVETIADLRPWP